jgi:hypothetical protein
MVLYKKNRVAEYEDDTHFYLYFTGTESEWGLPDKDSLIVTIKTGSIHEEIWGYAEFVVP